MAGFRLGWMTAVLAAMLCVFPEAGPAQTAETLRVATIQRAPFALRENGGWTGFSIELWKALGNALGVTTEFTEFETFPEMLAAVQAQDVDAAVANISITHSREQVLDFSQPIYDSGLLILKPINDAPSVLKTVLNPDLLIWLGSAFLLLILFGNLIWLVERRHQSFAEDGYSKGFSEGLWWSINVVTNASFTIFTPRTWAGRMLAYSLIVIGLFIVSAFVAQITTQLTVGQLRSQVDSYQDLRNKRVGTTEGSTSARFLQQEAIVHTTYPTIGGMFAKLESGDLDAVVHDAPILSYYAQTAENGAFTTVGRVFQPEKYGIALPQGSAMREDIDQALLLLRENGTYEAIRRRWFGN
ncbi:transporter substrate-binding domain-containing protein [Maritimibacter sp. 55A14]|uniref:transporter substrate-binding domain-containing protein n=1 Tax=Maritimibacter sp. 55A14 TaxID=2174844 RepID=UPI001304D2BF|nr:transporter substrate-binding domain-containing protein [Maritimibacter sp. 55A14]